MAKFAISRCIFLAGWLCAPGSQNALADGDAPAVVATPAIIASTPSMAVGLTHECGEYYPNFAKFLGETGQVFLTYDVGADGAIGNVTLVKSSGFESLDNKALDCVRDKWRNTPAVEDGKPVASPGHKAAIGFWLDPGRTAQFFYEQGLGAAFTAGGEKGLRNAIDHFGKAIVMNPDFTDAYYQRGLAFERLGDHQSAQADFAKAGKTPPATHE